MTRPRLPAFVPEALLLFAAAFGPLAFGATEPWSRGILELDLLLLAAACALRARANYAQPAYRRALPAVAVVLAMGFAQRWNPRPAAGPAALFPYTASAKETGTALGLWASYAALLWSAPQVFDTREARARFAGVLLGVGAFTALVGLLQRGQGNAAYYGLRAVRQGAPFGPYVNRNHAASFFVMTGFVGAGLLAAHALDRRRRDSFGERSDRAAARLMMAFALLLLAAGVVGAGSRGAAVSCALAAWGVAALATRFVSRRGPRLAARAGVIALAGALALVAARRPLLVGGILGAPDASTAYRLSMYRSGAEMLKDFPVWGVGLGAARAVYPIYRESMVSGVVEHLHSDWLELTVELGLVGALALVAGLAAFLADVVAAWTREPSRTRRLLGAGTLAAAAAFLLHEAVDFSFQVPANAVTFFALLAYLSALTAPDAQRGLAAAPGAR